MSADDRVTDALRARLPALVDALHAAGFDVNKASPLQHYGPCGFWQHQPCDCPIQRIAALLREPPEDEMIQHAPTLRCPDAKPHPRFTCGYVAASEAK